MLVAWTLQVGQADRVPGIAWLKIFGIPRREARPEKINFVDLFSEKNILFLKFIYMYVSSHSFSIFGPINSIKSELNYLT